ncbi:hypothetical protein MAPG_00209 [Magnaporthiopsis poae ATCC 64411]|uniref:Uncharacterized protein n=1 Tax=Magnaporthiopsis poae (strain ATCC 64411 / 73-15) TaxID=644358 RepID=A0A0C4DKE0_MAGP6|nr:hypothetical protein MAPG_00209 [Magnaporthiopsis poae ATCC 64411]
MVGSKNHTRKATPDAESRLPSFLRKSHRQNESMLGTAMVKRRQSTPVNHSPRRIPDRVRYEDSRSSLTPGTYHTAPCIVPTRIPSPDSNEGDGGKVDGEDSFQFHCQTMLDPNLPTNISAHLEIPISKDLDDELEAFSRCKRLGDFVAAKELLKEMDRHLDNPYILVQYADLLLDMGNYHAFTKLTSNPTLGVNAMDAEDEEMQLLSLNLKLLIAKANTHRQPTGLTFSEATELLFQALELEHLKLSPEMGATELRIVTLTIHLIAQTWPRSLSLGQRDRIENEWIDWAGVSRRLLTSHRDWEFRDLVLAGAALFGQQRFAEIVSEGGHMDYCIRWDEFESDVSATLAHLDLLVSLLQSAIPAQDGARMAKDRADAKSLASIIMAHHPRAMRSRTFGHWLLVETAMAGREASGAGAQKLAFVKLMDLPKPVPSAFGVPDWPGFQVPPTANEPIRTAMAMAKEMEDYTTQAACHRLLAQRSCKPVRELRELYYLQAAQGDRTGQHATCLARYYGCSDSGSQIGLLNDLKSFEGGQVKGFDGTLPERHRIIKEALQSHLMPNGIVDERPEPSNGDQAQGPGLTSLGTFYREPEKSVTAFPSEGNDQTLVLARPRYGPNPETRKGRDYPTSSRHLAEVQQRNDNVKIPSPRERPAVSEPKATRDEIGFRYEFPNNPRDDVEDYDTDSSSSDYSVATDSVSWVNPPLRPQMPNRYPWPLSGPPTYVDGTLVRRLAAGPAAESSTGGERRDPLSDSQGANTRSAPPPPREVPSRKLIMEAPPSRRATTEGVDEDRQQPSNPVERPEGSRKSLSLSLQAFKEAEADLEKSRVAMEEAFLVGDNARANSLKAFTIPDQERLVKQLGKATLAARAAAASASTVRKPIAKPAQDRVEALRGEEAPESRRPRHKPRRQTEVGEAPKRASTGSLLVSPGTWETPSSRPKSSGGGSGLADKEMPGQCKEETKPKPEATALTAGEANREEDATGESVMEAFERRVGKGEGRKNATREEQNDKIEAREKSLPAEKAPAAPEKACVHASEGVGEVLRSRSAMP